MDDSQRQINQEDEYRTADLIKLTATAATTTNQLGAQRIAD